MIYLLDRADGTIHGTYTSIKLAKEMLTRDSLDEANYRFLQDANMNYISRITHVDGVCVYNNPEWWTNTAHTIQEDYSNHTVTDILGQTVTKSRFDTEYFSNNSRIATIDGRPGQIDYDIQVGKEFISLFREECILTDFDRSYGVTPMTIFAKLGNVQVPSVKTDGTTYTMNVNIIDLITLGCFREAALALQCVEPDVFLTTERLAKYIEMLNAADAIEYATEDDYYYTVTTGTSDETSNS